MSKNDHTLLLSPVIVSFCVAIACAFSSWSSRWSFSSFRLEALSWPSTSAAFLRLVTARRSRSAASLIFSSRWISCRRRAIASSTRCWNSGSMTSPSARPRRQLLCCVQVTSKKYKNQHASSYCSLTAAFWLNIDICGSSKVKNLYEFLSSVECHVQEKKFMQVWNNLNASKWQNFHFWLNEWKFGPAIQPDIERVELQWAGWRKGHWCELNVHRKQLEWLHHKRICTYLRDEAHLQALANFHISGVGKS